MAERPTLISLEAWAGPFALVHTSWDVHGKGLVLTV